MNKETQYPDRWRLEWWWNIRTASIVSNRQEETPAHMTSGIEEVYIELVNLNGQHVL
jgi:hypothetical protein